MIVSYFYLLWYINIPLKGIENITLISHNLLIMEDRNFKKLFGARVRYLRKIAGLSQEKLAELTGLSTKTISYIENSKNTLSVNKLPLLAKALNVPVYKLFVFEADIDNKEKLEYLLNSATEKEINALAEIIKTILAIK